MSSEAAIIVRQQQSVSIASHQTVIPVIGQRGPIDYFYSEL